MNMNKRDMILKDEKSNDDKSSSSSESFREASKSCSDKTSSKISVSDKSSF